MRVVAIRSDSLWQAKYDGRACVLKEFVLRDNKEKSLFMNEVKRLRALSHPFVVAVEAVFASIATIVRNGQVDLMTGFIQLPLYVGGDLARWLVCEEHIRFASDDSRFFFAS